MQGVSPCQGRSRPPPVPRVAPGEEEQKPCTTHGKRPQGTLEAGRVTAPPAVWDSLGKALKADGDSVHAPAATTKASGGREAGGSVGGHRAWHAEREALRTWEIPGTPGDRETPPTTSRAVHGPWDVGSPQSPRRTEAPSTGGRGGQRDEAWTGNMVRTRRIGTPGTPPCRTERPRRSVTRGSGVAISVGCSMQHSSGVAGSTSGRRRRVVGIGGPPQPLGGTASRTSETSLSGSREGHTGPRWCDGEGDRRGTAPAVPVVSQRSKRSACREQ